MAVLYYAIYLNEESRKALLAAFPAIHKTVYAEHITVAFKPSPDKAYWLERCLGQTIDLTVTGLVLDGKGQAVCVREPVRLDEGIAHITISCAEGTKPVYSNSLFQAMAVIELATPLVVTGTLEHNRT